MSKKAALQLQLTDEQTKRVDRCAGAIQAKSRAEFADRALDFIMPLIETGKMVNLNGRLVLAEEAKKQLTKAA